MKDIVNLERIQRRATKHILNDYTSCYKDRLLNLKLLSLIYIFELQNILFAIKSLRSPTNQFNINNLSVLTLQLLGLELVTDILYPNTLTTLRDIHRLPSL